MALNPGDRLAHYEVIAPLGAGGMGEVYKARDTRLGREVAIKILPDASASNPERIRRFEQEARAASALSDPHIVTVFDTGAEDGTFYIVSELVDGRDLRSLLTQPLPLRRALDIASQIASGLAVAHEKGIVHRDLKPENILLTKAGLAKIADFGLAKLEQDVSDGVSQLPTMPLVRTASGVIVGTVAYMSPEQAGGQPVDFRSDQFSLGLILYEMLAGRRAFRRSSAPETLAAIIRDDPEPLPETSPPIPAFVRWIVDRCLQKEPGRRYDSTADLAREIVTVRDHLSELTSAQIPSAAPSRPRKWSLVVAGIVAVALVIGALLGRWLAKPAPFVPPAYQQLTFQTGTVSDARFAPDGQTILYDARWRGGPRRIYSTRVGSIDSTELDLPEAYLYSISSSGRVAIGIEHAGRPPTLAEVSLAGGAPREILDGVWNADWAPDGEHLAVTHVVQGHARLEYPIGTTIFDSGTAGDLFSVRFSPDGRYLAFIADAPTGEGQAKVSNSSVYVYDLVTKKTRLLSSGWDTGISLAWPPGGGEIWFSARRATGASGGLVINAVDLQGRERVVDRLPWVLVVNDIRKDGLVLLQHDYWPASISFRGPGDKSERDLSWLEYSIARGLSADGRTLLFGELGISGGARGAVYIRPTDGSSAPVRLGEGRPMGLSPDGMWAIALNDADGDKMILLPTGPGQPIELTRGDLRVLDAEWFPDSRRVLFQAVPPGKKAPQLYEEEIAERKARVQPLPSSDFGPISPDGGTTASNGPTGEIVLTPLDGGAKRVLRGTSAEDRAIRWSTDGRDLFLRSGTMPAHVFRYDIESGRREPLADLAPTDPSGISSIDRVFMSGDGRAWCYSYVRFIDSLYLVTGLR